MSDEEKKEFVYDFNNGRDEFSDTPYLVKEREMKELKERLEKVEKTPSEGKKPITAAEIEADIDGQVYKDLYKKERLRKYDVELKKEEEAAIKKEKQRKSIEEIDASTLRGQLNDSAFAEKHPKLAKLRQKINATRMKVNDNEVVESLKNGLEEKNNEYLIKNGVPTELIDEYNQLKFLRDFKRDLGDTEGAQLEQRMMTKVKSEMKMIVDKNKLSERKNQVELKKLDLLLNPSSRYPKSSPIKVSHPPEWKHRNLGRAVSKDVKLLGGGRGIDINLNSTSSAGRIRGLPVFQAPSQPRTNSISPRDALNYVKNLHARKEYEREYARQIQAQKQRNADAAVSGSIVNQQRQETIRGEIPKNELSGQLPVRLNRTGFDLPSQMVKIRQPQFILPNQRNAVNNPVIRITAGRNNRWVGQTPQQKNKLKPVGVNVTSRIAAGVESMVSPIRNIAYQQRSKVFGPQNTCRIRDVTANTLSIGKNHHTGRKFGLDVSIPKVNIGGLVVSKKKKKGMK